MILQRKEKRDKDGLRILITGGVTGGHLFPGIAVAEAFVAHDPDNRMLFVSIGNELERNMLSQKGFDLVPVTVSGIKGKGFFSLAKTLFNLPRSLWQAWGQVRRFSPHLVISVGSFAAGPATLVAWVLRKKIVLCEQNIIPGITNRLLSRLADRIYISFDGSANYFDAKKVKCYGNPVRREFFEQTSQTGGTVAAGGQKEFVVLIVGGSQGAHHINMSVIEALGCLPDKKGLRFIHQTGIRDEAMVKDAYDVHGVRGDVRAFFNDMGYQYKMADLVICRSGATTIAELTAIGKPAVFVPFPNAADNHQHLNARFLAEAGAAEMIPERDLTGKGLAEKITFFRNNPAALAKMAQKARQLGHPDASHRIVQDCYDLLAENSRLMLLLNFFIKE